MGSLAAKGMSLNCSPGSPGPKWLWFWDTPQGSRLHSDLLAYSFGRLGEPVRGELEGKKPGREERGGVLCLSSKLGTTCHHSGRLSCLSTCSGLWTGDLSVLHHSASSLVSLNHDTFSVNEKTNIQDIRIMRRHLDSFWWPYISSTENLHPNICIFSVLV